jgi:hypothetical protein
MSAPLSILIEVLGETKGRAALAALDEAAYICVPCEPTKEVTSAALGNGHWTVVVVDSTPFDLQRPTDADALD